MPGDNTRLQGSSLSLSFYSIPAPPFPTPPPNVQSPTYQLQNPANTHPHRMPLPARPHPTRRAHDSQAPILHRRGRSPQRRRAGTRGGEESALSVLCYVTPPPSTSRKKDTGTGAKARAEEEGRCSERSVHSRSKYRAYKGACIGRS